ncbi:MAG TPA: hypothetical protein GXX19_13870 [Syntrophomonadaceae bacterium]|nr:hypothetical protein [Syntrophomonadaceae bacterium]
MVSRLSQTGLYYYYAGLQPKLTSGSKKKAKDKKDKGTVQRQGDGSFVYVPNYLGE